MTGSVGRFHPAALRLAGVVALLAAIPLLAVPMRGAVHAASPPAIAAVRYIYHGLAVQPPRHPFHPGHPRDPLYDQYGLRTQSGQKASVAFRDGTTLALNQNTDAVLSGHVTRVSHGEVAQYLAPGTDHRIYTTTITTYAIGTTFDVRIAGSSSVVVVLHGALQVSTPQGSVVVRSNQQTTATPGQAPLPPSPVDAQAVFAWTAGIPTPDLGEDVALDANGGQVVSFSSERQGAGDKGRVQHINDGLLTEGWESASGKTANQTVTVGFRGGSFYRISGVIIDPAATYGDPPSEDLKDFAIRVSSTTTASSAFTTVYVGTCKQADRLQVFTFPVPVRAKYVQLVAQDNYGSTQRIAVAEWEVVATGSLFAQPAGVAVDGHGFVYVADANANRIDKLSSGGKLLAQWGSKGSGNGQLLAPEGVAVAPNGDVYVADTGNARIEVFSPRGHYLRTWGSFGIQNGQLDFPRGIAIDRKGSVYVADISGDPANPGAVFLRVQKFSAVGRSLAVFTNLANAGMTPRSGGIALDPKGNLWLTNWGADTILKVAPTGQVLATIGGNGTTAGKFNGPQGIAVDRAGNVYVTDLFNARVQRISAGGFVQSWGAFGVGPRQFALPEGVAADSAGNVYVADTFNGRIQKLQASNGKVKAIWGKYATIPTVLGQPGGIAIDPHGDIWIADSSNDRIQVRSPTGNVLAVVGHHGVVAQESGTAGLGQFWNPQGLAIAPDGEVFVADTNNCRIQELAPRGPIGALGGGTCGTNPGQFKGPYAVALDAQGNLYVADTYADRVLKLSPSGAVLWTYAVAGFGPGQLDYPEGIAVDREGHVYVANHANPTTGMFDGRIVKLSAEGKPLATWGTADQAGASRFFAPQGLAIDQHEDLYVADLGHNAIQKLSTDGKVLAVFPLPDRAQPTAVAVDAAGYLYVADGPNERVLKLSPGGRLLAVWR